MGPTGSGSLGATRGKLIRGSPFIGELGGGGLLSGGGEGGCRS